jgi:hypothetical protein
MFRQHASPSQPALTASCATPADTTSGEQRDVGRAVTSLPRFARPARLRFIWLMDTHM